MEEETSREFPELEYTNISAMNQTIIMAYGNNVDNAEANSYVLETIAGTKGLTTIAPDLVSIADTNGNINSCKFGLCEFMRTSLILMYGQCFEISMDESTI